jgi:hypothetical protein
LAPHGIVAGVIPLVMHSTLALAAVSLVVHGLVARFTHARWLNSRTVSR